jgi:hypothetical protein
MKWEYKVIEVRVRRIIVSSVSEDIGVKLDEYGADGWELIRVLPIIQKGWLFFGGSFTDRVLLFFKRQGD